jgi:hypothetical protein
MRSGRGRDLAIRTFGRACYISNFVNQSEPGIDMGAIVISVILQPYLVTASFLVRPTFPAVSLFFAPAGRPERDGWHVRCVCYHCAGDSRCGYSIFEVRSLSAVKASMPLVS